MSNDITDDIPRSDERAIAIRLRDHGQCQACNRTADEVDLEVHQIVPGAGSNQMSNFVLLCSEHHRDAHAQDGAGTGGHT